MILYNLLKNILGVNCFGGGWPKDTFYKNLIFKKKRAHEGVPNFKKKKKKTFESDPRFSYAESYFLNHILKDQKSPVVIEWNYEISYVISLV